MAHRFRHLSGARRALIASLAPLVCALTVGCSDDGAPAAIDAPGATDGAPIDGPAAIDAPIATDGAAVDGPSASPSEINCGATDVCDRASEVCCFTGFPNITTACTATAACTNLPGRCDGPEDCSNGDICCGTQQGSECRAVAQCTGMTSARLCHTAADCASGQICRASQFVAWPICAAM